MSQRVAIAHTLLVVEAGGVILANMLEGWLDEIRKSSSSLEAGDEFHDQRATPEQDCLRICEAIDAGASAPSDFATLLRNTTPQEPTGTPILPLALPTVGSGGCELVLPSRRTYLPDMVGEW
jgi:hypothetical protein